MTTEEFLAPPSATCADVALTAMLVAIAYMARAGGGTGAALRMRTLAICRRGGLAATRDVLGELASCLHRLGGDRRAARRVMVGAMTPLVGSDWAPVVLDAAHQIAGSDNRIDEAAARALDALRAALALPPVSPATARLGPPDRTGEQDDGEAREDDHGRQA